jgi:hypothetical protein
MSVLQKLTEGISRVDRSAESHALMQKWSETGLLEGLDSEHVRNNMARLLENQAAELLREASSMAAGDVEGFAAVAFPIVRRVFGALIANELVSVQPMSLPSGLIFFLDFTTDRDRLGSGADESVYGGARVASQITGGVDISEAGGASEKSFYNLNNGYSSPTGSLTGATLTAVASGTVGLGDPGVGTANLDSLLRYDPDLVSGTTTAAVFTTPIAALEAGGQPLNRSDLVGVTIDPASVSHAGTQVRRLTQKSDAAGNLVSGDTYTHLRLVLISLDGAVTPVGLAADTTVDISFPMDDNFESGNALGSVRGVTEWGLEAEEGIPEIDIKVDSVEVTAKTKKLKAKWTPELGQDLNAYHNLDAEVELTSILSEQIGLEIDQELLEDLIKGASAAVYYWSRRPGKFLNRETGGPISTSANEALLGADFTGTVSEWYETLVETINDVSAQIYRKTLRGGANFLVCGPEVANLLEFTSGFRANVVHDDGKGDVGVIKTGNLSKKWDVYVDPYFPRNVILVGRKGSSFLESGYVYAPYVPLQVTPTIFGVEDFVPRKGVMTRYAKKMVRPDLYGLVIVQDLLG